MHLLINSKKGWMIPFSTVLLIVRKTFSFKYYVCIFSSSIKDIPLKPSLTNKSCLAVILISIKLRKDHRINEKMIVRRFAKFISCKSIEAYVRQYLEDRRNVLKVSRDLKLNRFFLLNKSKIELRQNSSFHDTGILIMCS